MASARTKSKSVKAPPHVAAARSKAISKTAKAANVTARRDVAPPAKTPKGKARKAAPAPVIVEKRKDSRDSLDPLGSVSAQLLKKLRDEKYEFNRAQSTAKFDESSFYDFFGPEIDAELEKVATIYNDRYARWPCQCCDVIIPVPRRTEVFHGDYHLVHDDIMGLLVNGERWIPRAETPLEVVQPGRLRNPWTGKTLEGKTLGTTGV